MKAVSHLHVQQYCCHGNCFSTNNVQLLYCLAYGLILVNFDAFYAFISHFLAHIQNNHNLFYDVIRP